MHTPLIQALQSFPKSTLPTGMQLFHGGRSKSPHCNETTKQLSGTRKWLSQSAEYAVSYAFNDIGELGSHLLWVCELQIDIPSLEGSQFSLIQVSPWTSSFPWDFPNAFHEYAKTVIPGNGSRALLDHKANNLFKEILITEPVVAIKVVDVVVLPQNKPAAEALAFSRFNC